MSAAPVVEWISLVRTLRAYRPDRAISSRSGCIRRL